MPLQSQQELRYQRNLALSEFGESGQLKLQQSRILIIGVGGLGSPVAFYLAAAGIGTLGLMDGDHVDLSNLQRQILHTTPDLGQSKVDSAYTRLTALNPEVKLNLYPERFTAQNAPKILPEYDFVIDCTDNFASKFLIADQCHAIGRTPYSHAGIRAYTGQTMTVLPGQTACYRCLFNAPPADGTFPTGAKAGVLGVLPGVIGSIQATEAIKFILGQGQLLTNRILTYDALQMTFRTIPLSPNPSCPLCGATENTPQ